MGEEHIRSSPVNRLFVVMTQADKKDEKSDLANLSSYDLH